MVWWWWIVPGFVGVVGLAIFLSGLGWLFRGRPFKGGRGAFGGAIFLGIAACVGLIGLNIQTYHRLAEDRQYVGTLEFHKAGGADAHTYEATFTEPSVDESEPAQTRTDQIRGDEWLLRARILRWKPWATVLGLNAMYRLDSLDGTWMDQDARRNAPPTVFDLRPVRRTGIDFLPVAEFLSKYAPIVKVQAGPTAGQAAFWPIADGAIYKVYITAQGDLRVDAANPAASDAVNEWMARGGTGAN